jgi:proline dehydrogenase
VDSLCDIGIRVRLCKGAYLENRPAVAFPRKADVDLNYVNLMKILLDRGNYPAIATHDEKDDRRNQGLRRGPESAPREL